MTVIDIAKKLLIADDEALWQKTIIALKKGKQNWNEYHLEQVAYLIIWLESGDKDINNLKKNFSHQNLISI